MPRLRRDATDALTPQRREDQEATSSGLSSQQSSSRRTFLGGLAAGVASLGVASFPRPANAAANSELGIGILGAGGKGKQLAGTFDQASGARVIMVADPDIERAETTAKPLGAKAVQDLRSVLDNDDVDAVVIATCDHWHCLAALWALAAGKDVYVEKPLSHNHWEGRQVVAAAEKTGRIVQLGTQQRSDPIQQQARDFLHAKKSLGEIQYVQANRLGYRGDVGKRKSPLAFPKTVDQDLWYGPAEVQPIYREKLHYDWHWDWNTGTGEMGNWGVHILDDVRNVAYQDSQSLPQRYTVGGGRVMLNDAGETPNVHFALLETSTFPTVITLSNLASKPGTKGSWYSKGNENWPSHAPSSGYVIVCEGGYYMGRRQNGEAVDKDGKTIRKFSSGTDIIVRHVDNFIKAVQNRDASILNAPIENGHFSTGWCTLANAALRAGGDFDDEQLTRQSELAAWPRLVGQMTDQLVNYGGDPSALKSCPTLTLDSDSETFVGEHCEVVNKFLRRSYRSGYEIKPVAEMASVSG